MGGNSGASDLTNLSAEQKRFLLERLLKEKIARSKSFPMSHGQQGLWHDFRRKPDSTAFNVFLPTRIKSPLQPDVLQAALAEISTRHASLRTTFSDADGELIQNVSETLLPGFSVELLPDATEEQIRHELHRQAAVPFDLEHGPLIRMNTYRIAAEDWVVFAQAHHIVVDFWSLVLILGELRTLYPQIAGGQPQQLPTAQNNYRKFVEQQSAFLDSPAGLGQRDYWATQSTKGESVLDLPTDFVRPSQFSGRAAILPLSLPDGTGQKLTNLATKQRITPVSVVHAVLAATLSGFSGQEKFYIGSPFSGRNQRDSEETVGFYVNVLPLLADVSGNPTFELTARRSAETLIDALDNENYPISRIVADCGVVRDTSRSPLFQVSCTFEKSQVKQESGRGSFLFPDAKQSWDFAGMRQESFYFPHPTCHYDLEFIFELSGNELKGMLCYCEDVFAVETMQQIAQVFADVLAYAMENPTARISELLSVGAVRQPELASTSIAPSVPAGKEQTKQKHEQPLLHVCNRICDKASDDPAGVAAITEKGTWTYGDLVAIASDLAHSLSDAGARPGDRIPVVCESGVMAFAGMLGVQLAGGVPIPVDASQPAVPWETLSQDTGAERVVCDTVTDWAGPSVPKFQPAAQPPTIRRANRQSPGRDNDAAYVVYTSGSTGQPKGVEVQYSAIGNTLAWRQQAVPLGPGDRVLMLLSHQFDAALGVAWTTFTQGATLVWPSAGLARDPNLLVEFILDKGITVLPAVPSLLKLVVQHPRFSECKSLRYVWTGGEAMPTDLPAQIAASKTAGQFWNFYGPTETAVEATAVELLHHDANRPIPIGYAIDGCEILILGNERQELPDTMPGEIAIGGVGLARGYVNAPELTSQRFVAHPVNPGQRVYLTGDRGRKLTSGAIEFFGRTDHQVKLRGYRLELSEIEAVADESDLVRRCAAKVVQGADASEALALFVEFTSPDAGHTQTTTEESADYPAGHQAVELTAEALTAVELVALLRQYIATRLPGFKRPDAIVTMDRLPILTSGKVDRKRLPQSIDAATMDRQTVAPRGRAEQAIHDHWCSVIGRAAISADANFFAAGGTSLQAAMLTSQLSTEVGVRVPAALVFDLATIRSMSQRLYDLHPQEMSEHFGPNTQTGAIDKSGPASLLTPLRTEGSRQPVFLVHPPGGIVICYQELTTHLGDDQPVYGIRSRGLHGDEALPESIQEMAAEYLDAMRQVQPKGPYIIGGWSLGGLIAYEIAKQCIALGEDIRQLVLIDTTIPERSTELVPEQERVDVGREYGIELTLEQLGELAPEEQLPLLLDHAQKLGVLEEDSPPEVIAQTIEDLQSLFHRHVELATQYRLEPMDCPTLLFRPLDMPVEIEVAEDRGWGYLIPKVDVEFVPGHHHSMVQNLGAAKLAETLADYLSRSTDVCEATSPDD